MTVSPPGAWWHRPPPSPASSATWPTPNVSGSARWWAACPGRRPATAGSMSMTMTPNGGWNPVRSEEHTSELQSRGHLVCRLLLEKKKHHTILQYHASAVDKPEKGGDDNKSSSLVYPGQNTWYSEQTKGQRKRKMESHQYNDSHFG